ncbi:hypothetical protein MKY84_05270 [Chryseomicrobium sp. FSL W7-1435]|uniref:hypothetical protein n=1 Tax=Chryseomicrobium sp. FSL W7-1435 TaxID=2921704 RepID=UPI003159963F
MKKGLSALGILMLLVLGVLLIPTTVFAKSDITIKANAGFDNKVLYGEGVPLTITLQNNGDDFSGDIVIDTPESYEIGSARALPLTLAAGETKTITLSLTSLTEDYMYSGTNTQMIFLYEGGWEDGKEVDFKGDRSVRPSFFAGDTIFLFTLTESTDRLTALRNIKFTQGLRPEVISLNHLKNGVMPTSKKDWEMASVVILDEFSIADWSDSEQQALLDWVSAGGTLIAGATSKGEAEFGQVAAHLPLKLSNNTATITPEQAQSYAKTTDLPNAITIQQGTLTEGAVNVWSIEDTSVTAMKKLGDGVVIQTAFSLGDKPLSSEKGYDELLTTLFNDAKIISSPSSIHYGNQSVLDSIGYESVYVNELFPSFEVSVQGIAVIIFIYFLLVGPLLYFVLKRKDKREHSWWIIPSIAILTSVAIFGYGARDRIAKPQVHQLSFYEMQQDGTMNGHYVETLLSNRSGEYKLTAGQGTSMSTWKGQNFSGDPMNTRMKSILENEAESPSLTLRNVAYWSTSTILGESTVQSTGKLNVNIENNSETITGTIENTFPFPVTDVQIWTGAKKIDLGDIEAGATLQVNEKHKGGLLLPAKSGSANYSGGYYGGAMGMTSEKLPEERKKAILNAYSMYLGSRDTTTPLVVAIAKEPIVPIQIQDERAELDATNLLIQPFESSTLFKGEFSLPFDSMEVSVYSDKGLYAEKTQGVPNEWFMENGEFTYEVGVPKNVTEQSIVWKELSLTNSASATMTVELLNQKTGEFEPVTETRTKLTENIADYINKEQVIELRLSKLDSSGNDITKVPEIALTGEVAQ